MSGYSASRDPIYTVSLIISVIVLFVVTMPLLVTFVTAFNPTTQTAFPPTGFSLRWFENVFNRAEFVAPFRRSILIAVMSGVCAMTLGTMCAVAITRRNFKGRDAIDAVLMSPLIVPQVILGLSFLVFSVRFKLLSSMGTLIVLHCVLTLPYAIRVIRASLQSISLTPEEAGIGLGASAMKSFFLITLPQIKPGIFAASFFCFVISFDNFTATAFLAQSDTTLPVEIFFYIETQVDPTISAIAALMMIGTVAFVTIIDRLVGIKKIT